MLRRGRDPQRRIAFHALQSRSRASNESQIHSNGNARRNGRVSDASRAAGVRAGGEWQPAAQDDSSRNGRGPGPLSRCGRDRRADPPSRLQTRFVAGHFLESYGGIKWPYIDADTINTMDRGLRNDGASGSSLDMRSAGSFGYGSWPSSMSSASFRR